MARPAILFDRDGTLNVDHGYTFRPSDLVWAPGAREAVLRTLRSTLRRPAPR